MRYRRNVLLSPLILCLGASCLLAGEAIASHRNDFSHDSYDKTNEPQQSNRHLAVSYNSVAENLNFNWALLTSVFRESKLNQASNLQIVSRVALPTAHHDQGDLFQPGLLPPRFDRAAPPPPPPPPPGRPPHRPPPPPPPPPPGRPPR